MIYTNAYLENNRPVTLKDYEKTFKLCRQTAAKRLKMDKDEISVSRYMVSHFYDIYVVYPKGFTPRLVQVPKC